MRPEPQNIRRRGPMARHDRRNHISELQRMEIFKALVDCQDHRIPVEMSREVVAARYGITEQQILEIERDGIENNWPLL
jgi:DNA-binding XRE family transcriptional regulator